MMNVYDNLEKVLHEKYDIVKVLKNSERSKISVIRHKASGQRFVLREYEGCSDVYSQLLHISCPHLPKIIEVGEKDGRSMIIEEFIMGDTLSFILEGGLFKPNQAKKMLLQICKALWVLHSMGAVHRDIKPENIMLRGDEAVLIDFDASRIYKQDREMDTRVLGTVGYAAPEQYGISQSDERADIYALGVLLNMMLTGIHPSKALASGKMGRIVQKCTMMNPEKRFKSVLHLMEAL